MRKNLVLVLGLSFFVFGSYMLANAQNFQMGDMQKQMMQSMQQQMMGSMGSGGGGGGGMAGGPMGGGAQTQAVSQEKALAGAKTFADVKLGTSGKSCHTCHSKPGVKPLDGRKVDYHLATSIQYCYNKALKGPGIIAENRLNNIVDYFKSLQR